MSRWSNHAEWCCITVLSAYWASFALNAKCGAVMLDEGIALAATRAFTADLANSRHVTTGDIDTLSIFSRAFDAGAYWMRSQL